MSNKQSMKKKPRVFLGTLSVASEKDLRIRLEEICWFPEKEIDKDLHRQLSDIFNLPKIPSKQDASKKDLGLDVMVSSFHTGDGIEIHGLPIFWMPKVTLIARLYNVQSGQTLETFEVTEKARWREYLSRYFTLRAMLNINRVFRTEDLIVLLNRGSTRLLEKIVTAAYKYA